MTNYLDIIFFAVIACILLWRLRGVLGTRSEDDVSTRLSGPNGSTSGVATQATIEAAVKALPSDVIASSPINWSAALPNYDIVATATVHHRLIPFLAVDPGFYPDDFIVKARKAFPTIVTAFSKSDKKTLEFLVSPSLFKAFADQIDARAAKNEVFDVSVQDVKKALITDAQLDGTVATVTVDFTAVQSVLHKSANGNVIGREDGHTETTKDRWVFSKDLKSSDPKWTLVKTEEIT